MLLMYSALDRLLPLPLQHDLFSYGFAFHLPA